MEVLVVIDAGQLPAESSAIAKLQLRLYSFSKPAVLLPVTLLRVRRISTTHPMAAAAIADTAAAMPTAAETDMPLPDPSAAEAEPAVLLDMRTTDKTPGRRPS
jgi:hypothetical protein